MKREPGRLREGPFDLLVIGGGIYGAWTAYDAALRGLRVALVERDDWSAATSSASSKLIHGGLRYLEHGELGLVRKTLDERRRLARLGPHRVRPLRFLFPVYRGDRVGRLRLRLGLWFYDRLSGRGQPVPPHRYLSRGELLERVEIAPEELLGGFAFGDCVSDDARFALEIVDGALRAGAVAVNRAEARGLEIDGHRVVGARVEDRPTGEVTSVRAATTVCCAGPWAAELAAATGIAEPPAVRLTKGVHLVLPALASDEAVVISSNDDARVVFLVPWYGRTLFGTTDTDYVGDPAQVRVEAADVAYLLERAGRVLRETRWTPSDVIATFAGLRTLPATAHRAPSALSREWSLDEPAPGLLVPVGGKFTSARADAAAIVDRVIREAGRRPGPSPTLERPFPWCPPAPLEDWVADRVRQATALGVDEPCARQAALRHGARFERLLERIRAAPELGRRVVSDLPFCDAEIVHAVEDEMVVSLEDVLRRRVPLLLLARLEPSTLERVAAVVGGRLGWSTERIRSEIDGVAATLAVPRA